MEQTLIILKPDALMRAVAGEIIARFERAGLKIVAIKMLQPDVDHFHHHYETISQVISRRGQDAFDSALNYVQSGPVIALVLEGVGAVALARKMVGSTEPSEALPGTIRGDYAHVSFSYTDQTGEVAANLIHASGNEEEALAEIRHWFSESEIYNYEPVHARFTQPSPPTTPGDQPTVKEG